MSSGTGKMVMGVLAGLAVGALLGVLFAPEKGSETRKKMAQKGEDFVGGVNDKLKDLIDDLNQKIDSAKAKANENVSDATSTSDGTK